MKNVVLQKIEIKNFKGIKSYVLELNEKSEAIVAENGSGKSTIKEAYYWALGFENVKEVIPLKDNEEIPNLETSVVLNINIFDEEGSVSYELKRTLKGKYAKNENDERIKISNENAYYIDGGKKMSLKDYSARLEKLFGIEYSLLYILSNNDYFNNDIPNKWTQSNRRDFLLKLVRDKQISKSVDILKDFPSIYEDIKIKKKNIEELKRDYTSELLALGKRKDILINNIDENDLKIKEQSTIDFAFLENKKENLLKQLKVITETNAKLNHNAEIETINNEIAEINAEIIHLQREDERNKQVISNEIYNNETQYKFNEQKIKTLQRTIHDISYYKGLLEKTKLETWIGSTICPTCKQNIPVEQIESAKKNFEIDKQKRINAIEKDIEHYKTENLIKENDIMVLNNENIDIEFEIAGLKDTLDKFKPNPKIGVLKTQKESLVNSLKDKENNYQNLGFVAQIDNINKEIEEINYQLSNKSYINKLEEENNQYRLDLSANSQKEIELIKKKKDLKEYNLRISKSLVDLISSLFPNEIEYALFESNYGENSEREICTLLFNGVPYNSLSNGQKIRVNVETLITLQELNNINLPIWCDNYESLTYDLDIKQQLIKLIAQKGTFIKNIEKF